MNANHVQWENDSLVFYFVKTKGDQLEDKSGDLWLVYLNLCSCIGKVSSFTSRTSEWKFSSFPRKQPIRTLHKKISKGHTWKQRNVSYSWCWGALVRVQLGSEGNNNYVLVWMHGLSTYYVYLLEGFLEHGPSKGSVHPLQKSWWSIHRPISDSYIIFDKIICDFAASLRLYRFNRRRDGR